MDEIVALWWTGSSRLRRLLASLGAWKNFTITQNSYMSCIRTWPHGILSQLEGLFRLRIHPSAPQRLLPAMKLHKEDLIHLPRTLLTLDLGFIDAICDEDVVALPPSLLHLCLPYNTRISNNGLLKLPLSLEELNLRRNRIVSDSSSLPRRLVRYTGFPWAIRAEKATFEGFPPSLTRLSLLAPLDCTKRIESDYTWSADKLCCFSQCSSLLHLELTLVEVTRTPEVVEAWHFPPNLEVLYLNGFLGRLPSAALPFLPSSLQKLKLRSFLLSQLDWSDDDVAKLPPQLTHLEHSAFARGWSRFDRDVKHPTIACIPKLPRFLRTFKFSHLSVQGLKSQIVEHLAALPASLTTLSLEASCDSNLSPLQLNLESLPPHLTQFNGEIVNRLTPIPSQAPPGVRFHTLALNDYPASINLMANTLNSALELGWLTNAVRALSVDITSIDELLLLPPRLVQLRINFSDYGKCFDEGMLSLPDTLTILQCTSDDANALTDEALPALPHDLRILELTTTPLSANKYPFPRRLQMLDLGPTSPTEIYDPHFPPFLLDLTLRSASVRATTLSSLPSTLTRLRLTAWRPSEFLSAASFFPHLPACLLSLEIQYSISYLFDDDIASLPRGLLSLSIRDSGGDLTDWSASHWPPRMTDLSFRGDGYTFEGLLKLPKSIIKIEMPYAILCLPPPAGKSSAECFGSQLALAAIGNFRLPPHISTPL